MDLANSLIVPLPASRHSIRISFIKILIIGCLFPVSSAYSDSPITSTSFHRAYFHVPWVSEATQRELTPYLLRYLNRKNVPTPHKLAVVNALGWKFNADQGFSEIYANFLTDKYKLPGGAIFNHLDRLNSVEISILCYFEALGNYLNDEKLTELEDAIKIGILKDGSCYSARFVEMLIKSQLILLNPHPQCKPGG